LPEGGRHLRRAAILAISLQTVISAATYLVAKGTLLVLNPFQVAALRFALATTVMTLLAARRPGFLALGRRPQLFVLGLLAIPLNQLLFLTGIRLSTPTHAALLYALTPGFVFLLSVLLGRERASGLRIAGLLTALAGVFWVLSEKGLDLSRGVLRGDLLMLAAVLCWSVYSVMAKPLATRHGALPVTAWAFLWGTLVYLPLGWWHLRGMDPSAVPWAVWAGILYLALLTSVVAYFLWSWSLKHLEATQVAIFIDLQPPLTAALSSLFFHEPMTQGLVLGGALTLVGVTLTTRPARRPSPGLA
jgi:drug/metabolite transporter (DMT)-like permease